MDAGKTDAGQQVREVAVGTRVPEERSVQQELISRGGDEDIAVAFAGQRGPQFSPGLLDLLGGAGVTKTVQPYELQRNIEVTNKDSRGGRLESRKCRATRTPGSGRDSAFARTASDTSQLRRRALKSKSRFCRC